jgi:Na+/H+ antiporter NhaA
MTHQRTTSRLAFIARPEALRVARAMAAVRLGIGAIGVLAPGRLAWRLFLPGGQADEATALALRAAAGRDLALGLGTALASRRGPGPLRDWLLATALVDCCDALTIVRSKSASAAVRTVTALVSGLSAGAQVALARRLTR